MSKAKTETKHVDHQADTAPAAPAPVEAPALVEVRALIDLPRYGARSGKLAAIDAGELAPLKADGYVDDNPAAVEYARALRAQAAG